MDSEGPERDFIPETAAPCTLDQAATGGNSSGQIGQNRSHERGRAYDLFRLAAVYGDAVPASSTAMLRFGELFPSTAKQITFSPRECAVKFLSTLLDGIFMEL